LTPDGKPLEDVDGIDFAALAGEPGERPLTIEWAVRALRTSQMSRELPMFLPKEQNNAFN
jgi:hypothetical protein